GEHDVISRRRVGQWPGILVPRHGGVRHWSRVCLLELCFCDNAVGRCLSRENSSELGSDRDSSPSSHACDPHQRRSGPRNSSHSRENSIADSVATSHPRILSRVHSTMVVHEPPGRSYWGGVSGG